MPKNPGGKKAKKQKNSSDTVRQKEVLLPKQEYNQHVGKILKKYGAQRYDVSIESDTGHKGVNVNAQAHFKRKFMRAELDNYVLLEYSEDFRTFYIIDKYETGDIDELVQKGIINRSTSTNGVDDDLIFSDNINDDSFDISVV